MFDRVVCLNLDRRPDRWQRFMAELPADWPFVPVERVAAVDGKACEIPEWYGANLLRLNHPPRDWLRKRAGAWGCLQSHLAVWRESWHTCERLLVLEDDAVFLPGFVRDVQTFLSLVPDDWDQLYFGGEHLKPPEEFAPGVFRGVNVNRTHAYAIRRPMMLAMAAHFSEPWAAHREQDWHVDHQLGRMHETGCWNVYAPTRWFVGQAGGCSDVQGRFTPFHCWQPPEAVTC